MHFRAEVYSRKQLGQALENKFIDKVYVPYNLVDESLVNESNRIIIMPPVFLSDCEKNVYEKMSDLKEIGFSNALVHTIGHIELLGDLNYKLHGGYRLNCTNTDSVSFLSSSGVQDIIVSPEITSFQINNLKSEIPIGFISYGYLPLMITRRCPIKNGKPCNKKNCNRIIKDRMNNDLRVICSENTAEILNSNVLFLADKLNKFENASFNVLKFTTEEDINQIVFAYVNKEQPEFISNFTRGLYFRGVVNQV